MKERIDQMMLKNFEAFWPTDAKHIVKYEQLSMHELELIRDDGVRLLYDDTLHSLRNAPTEDTELSEEAYRVEFARRLYKMMLHHQVNQGELGEMTGISRRTINDYINARRTPSSYNLERIAKALNCSVDALSYYPTRR